MERGAVWNALGPPRDQIGSVNEPRTQVDGGVRWNEKWVYPAAHADGSDRVVLWRRYDLLGVFKVRPDGSYEPDPGALGGA
jgi:hypothetical protein